MSSPVETPQIAVDFSQHGLRLMQFSVSSGWAELFAVPLDTDRLAEDMAHLAFQAREHGAEKVLVLLPVDQMQRLPMPDGPGADTDRAAKALSDADLDPALYLYAQLAALPGEILITKRTVAREAEAFLRSYGLVSAGVSTRLAHSGTVLPLFRRPKPEAPHVAALVGSSIAACLGILAVGLNLFSGDAMAHKPHGDLGAQIAQIEVIKTPPLVLSDPLPPSLPPQDLKALAAQTETSFRVLPQPDVAPDMRALRAELPGRAANALIKRPLPVTPSPLHPANILDAGQFDAALPRHSQRVQLAQATELDTGTSSDAPPLILLPPVAPETEAEATETAPLIAADPAIAPAEDTSSDTPDAPETAPLALSETAERPETSAPQDTTEQTAPAQADAIAQAAPSGDADAPVADTTDAAPQPEPLSTGPVSPADESPAETIEAPTDTGPAPAANADTSTPEPIAAEPQIAEPDPSSVNAPDALALPRARPEVELVPTPDFDPAPARPAWFKEHFGGTKGAPETLLTPPARPSWVAQKAALLRQAEAASRKAAAEAAAAERARQAARGVSALVVEESTEHGTFDLEHLSLIGVFTSNKSQRAILRRPNGSIVRVTVNSVVDGWRVLAIDANSVRLQQGGEIRILK